MAKKKEPDVPLDEAVYLTKKELTPRWIFSEPLFCVLKDEKGSSVSILPLVPDFGKKRIVLLFIDPTLLESDESFKVVKTWMHRYRDEDLQFVIVTHCKYPTFMSQDTILGILKKYGIVCATVIDSDLLIETAFGISEFPSVLIYDLSIPKPILRPDKGTDWVENGEKLIQRVLRDRDPGLPLEFFLKSNVSKIEKKEEISFKDIAGLAKGEFEKQPDHIIPKKAGVKIELRATLPDMNITAKILNILNEFSRVNIYLDDNPVFQQFANDDIQVDDTGQTFFQIIEPRVYKILKKVNYSTGYKITLEFVSADKAPVGLYGAMFFST